MITDILYLMGHCLEEAKKYILSSMLMFMVIL